MDIDINKFSRFFFSKKFNNDEDNRCKDKETKDYSCWNNSKNDSVEFSTKKYHCTPKQDSEGKGDKIGCKDDKPERDDKKNWTGWMHERSDSEGKGDKIGCKDDKPECDDKKNWTQWRPEKPDCGDKDDWTNCKPDCSEMQKPTVDIMPTETLEETVIPEPTQEVVPDEIPEETVVPEPTQEVVPDEIPEETNCDSPSDKDDHENEEVPIL